MDSDLASPSAQPLAPASLSDAERTSEALPVAAAAQPSHDVAALIDRYCDHHRAVENYVFFYRAVFGLLRRARIDPMVGRGRALSMLLLAVLFAIVPVAVSTWLDEWDRNPVPEWCAVVAGFAMLTTWAHGPLTRAIDAFLSLHRKIVDADGIQRLLDFELRWFRLRRSVPIAALFSFSIHVYLYYIEVYYQERPMTWGTATLTMLLLYQVGEIVYAVVLLALESRLLPRCQYALYRPSPIDTVALRRSLRGTSGLVGLVSLVTTGIIVGFALLVEDRPIFLNRVGLLLLASAYVAAFAALLLPRLAIKSIVHIAKENQLRPLQGRLSDLLENPVSMSEDQYKEYRRFRAWPVGIARHAITSDPIVIPWLGVGRRATVPMRLGLGSRW